MAKDGNKRSRGGLTKRTKLILLIIGIVILLGIIATILFLRVQKSADSSKTTPSNGTAASLDTRSEATKQASQKASQQAIGGDAATATKTLDDAIAATPSSNTSDLSLLYQQKATVAANNNQKDAAVAAQQAAIKLEPDNWRLAEGLGNIYVFLKDYPNALKSFQQADSLLSKSTVASDYDTYHSRLAGKIQLAQKAGN